MTQLRKLRINSLGNTPKKNHYHQVSEGYGKADDFIMSDNINDWMIPRSRRGKTPNKPLF